MESTPLAPLSSSKLRGEDSFKLSSHQLLELRSLTKTIKRVSIKINYLLALQDMHSGSMTVWLSHLIKTTLDVFKNYFLHCNFALLNPFIVCKHFETEERNNSSHISVLLSCSAVLCVCWTDSNERMVNSIKAIKSI